MKVLVAFVAIVIAGELAGCETTNFATSSTPATIRQEFVRHNGGIFSLDWEGSYVYGVRRYEIGYGDLGDRKGLTLRFDPGPAEIRVFYFGHKDSGGMLFLLTDVVTMNADLRPSANYTLHCDASEESVQFNLIDLQTKEVVASLSNVPLFHRPHPSPPSNTFIPVFIPSR